MFNLKKEEDNWKAVKILPLKCEKIHTMNVMYYKNSYEKFIIVFVKENTTSGYFIFYNLDIE